jgi:hypothetical protein
MALMSRELTRLQPTPLMIEVVNETIRPMANVLAAILEEMLPQVSMERRVLLGFSIMGQCLFYRQNRAVSEVLYGKKVTRNFDVEFLVEHVTDFTLTAIKHQFLHGRRT